MEDAGILDVHYIGLLKHSLWLLDISTTLKHLGVPNGR